MSVLAPGSGFAISRSVDGIGTEYFVLGPLAVDSWVDVIEVGLCLEGAVGVQGVSFGVGVAGSQSADQASFIASRSLIAEGEDNIDGKASLVFRTVTSVFATMRMFPGYHVQSGSVYLIFALRNGAAGAGVDCNVAVRTLRVVKSPGV